MIPETQVSSLSQVAAPEELDGALGNLPGFRSALARGLFGCPGGESTVCFGVRGSGVGIWDLGFGIWDSGFWIRDSGFGIRFCTLTTRLSLRS